MKAKINFTLGLKYFAPELLLTSRVVTAVLLVSTIVLVFHSGKKLSDIPGLHQRLQGLEKQRDDQVAAIPEAEQKKMRALRNRIAVLRRQLALSGAPVTNTLSLLEQHLPKGAALVSFHKQLTTGETRITLQSTQTEILTSLLKSLEGEANLKQVSLLSEERKVLGTKTFVQYDLLIKD